MSALRVATLSVDLVLQLALAGIDCTSEGQSLRVRSSVQPEEVLLALLSRDGEGGLHLHVTTANFEKGTEEQQQQPPPPQDESKSGPVGKAEANPVDRTELEQARKNAFAELQVSAKGALEKAEADQRRLFKLAEDQAAAHEDLSRRAGSAMRKASATAWLITAGRRGAAFQALQERAQRQVRFEQRRQDAARCLRYQVQREDARQALGASVRRCYEFLHLELLGRRAVAADSLHRWGRDAVRHDERRWHALRELRSSGRRAAAVEALRQDGRRAQDHLERRHEAFRALSLKARHVGASQDLRVAAARAHALCELQYMGRRAAEASEACANGDKALGALSPVGSAVRAARLRRQELNSRNSQRMLRNHVEGKEVPQVSSASSNTAWQASKRHWQRSGIPSGQGSSEYKELWLGSLHALANSYACDKEDGERRMRKSTYEVRRCDPSGRMSNEEAFALLASVGGAVGEACGVSLASDKALREAEVVCEMLDVGRFLDAVRERTITTYTPNTHTHTHTSRLTSSSGARGGSTSTRKPMRGEDSSQQSVGTAGNCWSVDSSQSVGSLESLGSLAEGVGVPWPRRHDRRCSDDRRTSTEGGGREGSGSRRRRSSTRSSSSSSSRRASQANKTHSAEGGLGWVDEESGHRRRSKRSRSPENSGSGRSAALSPLGAPAGAPEMNRACPSTESASPPLPSLAADTLGHYQLSLLQLPEGEGDSSVGSAEGSAERGLKGAPSLRCSQASVLSLRASCKASPGAAKASPGGGTETARSSSVCSACSDSSNRMTMMEHRQGGRPEAGVGSGRVGVVGHPSRGGGGKKKRGRPKKKKEPTDWSSFACYGKERGGGDNGLPLVTTVDRLIAPALRVGPQQRLEKDREVVSTLLARWDFARVHAY